MSTALPIDNTHDSIAFSWNFCAFHSQAKLNNILVNGYQQRGIINDNKFCFYGFEIKAEEKDLSYHVLRNG